MAAWLFAAAAAQAGSVEARHADALAQIRAAAGQAPNERFREAMDRVFGPGRWRETSGYRSPALEDRLRHEGAGTVAEGRLSTHSFGTPAAPGAYDAVVYGMSQALAAERLQASGTGFARVFAEGTHGPEGAHLHIEPGNLPFATASLDPPRRMAVRAVSCDSIYLRVVNGRINPQLSACSHTADD